MDKYGQRLFGVGLERLEHGRDLVGQPHGNVDTIHRRPVNSRHVAAGRRFVLLRPLADAVLVEVVAINFLSQPGEMCADVSTDGSESYY